MASRRWLQFESHAETAYIGRRVWALVSGVARNQLSGLVAPHLHCRRTRMAECTGGNRRGGILCGAGCGLVGWHHRCGIARPGPSFPSVQAGVRTCRGLRSPSRLPERSQPAKKSPSSDAGERRVGARAASRAKEANFSSVVQLAAASP